MVPCVFVRVLFYLVHGEATPEWANYNTVKPIEPITR